MSMNDPGLFTDATGEGMAGATDVRLSTQKTLYNGSASCNRCGYDMGPYESLLNELCPSCQRRQAKNRLKGGMV